MPDLLPISPSAPQNADGTFVYALTSVDKTHQGNGRYHHNQYYLTQQSQITLQSMIDAFAAEGWYPEIGDDKAGEDDDHDSAALPRTPAQRSAARALTLDRVAARALVFDLRYLMDRMDSGR